MNPEQPTPLPSPFEITITTADDTVWVTIDGTVDASNEGPIGAALRAIAREHSGTVQLGLTNLTFCDLAVAGRLLDFAETIRSNGGRVLVDGASTWTRPLASLLDPESAQWGDLQH